VRVLLTESASLTCRETLTVLGRRGVRADIVSCGALTIGQFSRWRARSILLPRVSDDPVGYVRGLGALAARYDAVLPTHEQAWLLAAARHLLPRQMPLAVATLEAFDRVQSKVRFAQLLDTLGIPQPRWWTPDTPPPDAPEQFWVKAAFSTAGRGVRHARSTVQARALARELAVNGMPVMCQESASGQYGQVQAVFDHGRMIGVHTCVVQDGVGVGGSSAARLSVDHPEARAAAQVIGHALGWHGGLTLDYFHTDGHPHFIECNPRTVEPGNAAAAGVDLPALMIALSRDAALPETPLVGRAGVRTHTSLALALGAAATTRSRRRTLAALTCDGGPWTSREVLTPISQDPISAVPLVVSVVRALLNPAAANSLAADAVDRYAVTPEIIERLGS
jgi:hypothetical protein